MAFVEGGAFKCSQHEFETESVKEWNDHCLQYPDIHYELNGETVCITCGEKIYYDRIPFHPIDLKTGSKNISLRCDDCNQKIVGSAKITKRSKSE